MLWSTKFSIAQKQVFTNYNVQNGLVQSQVLDLYQDELGQLYIATLGGISIYDGNSLKALNKDHGLLNNTTIAIRQSAQKNIVIAHINGLSIIQNNEIKTFPFSDALGNITNIEIDNEDRIWVLANWKLYEFKEEKFIPHPIDIQHDPDDLIIQLSKDENDKLVINSFKSGLHKWDGESKKTLSLNKQSGQYFLQFKHFKNANTSIAIRSDNTIITSDPSKREILTPPLPNNEIIHSFFIDNDLDYWMATSKGGIYYFHKNQWTHFSNLEGFSSETVTKIFQDKEGALWFATDGSGLFQFNKHSISYFDMDAGLPNGSIAAINEDINQQIIVAATSNGIYELKHDKYFQEIKHTNQSIRALSFAKNNKQEILIGSTMQGLLKWDGRQITKVSQNPFLVKSMFYDGEKLFLNIFNQLFKIEDKDPIFLTDNIDVLSYISFDKDHLLLGTLQQTYQLNQHDGNIKKFTEVPSSTIIAMEENKDFIFLGSFEDGLLIYNRNNKETSYINTTEGLSCNTIYSLLIDSKNNLWIGTGCGIDRIALNDTQWKVQNMSQHWNLGQVECNSGALFEDSKGNIWIGTNTLLLKYDPAEDLKENIKPKINLVFESIQLFSKDLNAKEMGLASLGNSDLPKNPIFRVHENHLTFNFKAISLSHATNVTYRYQLIGVDKEYTETQQHTVIYPNLSSGDYIFKVWIANDDGLFENTSIAYAFSINMPYWQTIYFWIGLSLLIFAIIFGFMHYRNKLKEERIIREQALKEKALAEVRQKTAEDFHDEIGNKLTRIKLLSNVAKIQASPENKDLQDILGQIMDNVQQLFSGAKDIIWALQPESDYLNEALWKINENANTLTENIDVDYQSNVQNEDDWAIQLPMQWTRNIVLIFKEALNNAIKHAEASHIQFNIKENEHEIILSLEDDGIGLPEEIIYGNGLKNMRNRAKRMDADLLIESQKGKGTRIQLNFSKESIK